MIRSCLFGKFQNLESIPSHENFFYSLVGHVFPIFFKNTFLSLIQDVNMVAEPKVSVLNFQQAAAVSEI